MATNPIVNTANAAGSPFWDIQASDFLATALSGLNTLSSAKVAKALAVSQQSNPPTSTLDSVKQGIVGSTNLASIAAVVGTVFVLFAGGMYLFKKVK